MSQKTRREVQGQAGPWARSPRLRWQMSPLPAGARAGRGGRSCDNPSTSRSFSENLVSGRGERQRSATPSRCPRPSQALIAPLITFPTSLCPSTRPAEPPPPPSAPGVFLSPAGAAVAPSSVVPRFSRPFQQPLPSRPLPALEGRRERVDSRPRGRPSPAAGPDRPSPARGGSPGAPRPCRSTALFKRNRCFLSSK